MFKVALMGFLLASVSLSLTATPCLATAPNLVSNCGFETGNFSGWTLSGYDSAPGFNGVDYGVDTADAHSGSYGAYLGGFGGVLDLSQQIATTPGSTYTISFWLAQAPTPVAPYLNSVSASFGSALLISQTQLPNTAFTEYSFTSTAAAPLTTLTLGFRDDTGFFSLDDVSVIASSAVPEPSAAGIWLMASFILGLMVLASSRSAASK